MNRLESKDEIRRAVLQKRALLTSPEIDLLPAEIASLQNDKFNFYNQKISCFAPIRNKNEVNTLPIIKELCEKNEVYLPISDFTTVSMSHWRYQPGDLLIENRYGIPEPELRKSPLNPEEFDVIIVPVLAMDLYGNRLGYGKGFYDRFISACRADVITIGLHFFEPLSQLPVEANDRSLSYLITPNHCHDFRKIK